MVCANVCSLQSKTKELAEIKKTSRFVARNVATNGDAGGLNHKDCSLSFRSRLSVLSVCYQQKGAKQDSPIAGLGVTSRCPCW